MKLHLNEQTRRKLIAARGSRSLRDVAESLPITYAQLSRIECGKRPVDEELLRLIAGQYGLKVKVKVVQRVELTANKRNLP